MIAGSRLGPYEIVAPLGAGGMGEVYKARDTRLGRTVAIKILPSVVGGDARRRERFRREAHAIASVKHAHICTLHDIGEADGVVYLVMEYLDGETLEHRLLRGPLPIDEVVRIGRELADALAAAHHAGLIHRDLKPSNVMLTAGGATILDFGVAKWSGADGDDGASKPTGTAEGTLTRDGSIVGTIQYMAPEQVDGKPADARSDVFALGAMLYEMTTGRKAFEGEDNARIMTAILTASPAPMASAQRRAPPPLERLVLRCLDKSPDLRWQSARDLANALTIAVDSGPERAPARRRSRLAVVSWSAVAAVLLGALALVALLRIRERTTTTERGRPEMTFTKLTNQSGIQQSPSLSPDGKWIAYESNLTGHESIYLQAVGGQNAINLTQDSQDDDTQPAFSPDGEHIAFRSERQGGGLFVMGRTGESVRRITSRGYNPAWSPDGSTLVFATDTANPVGRAFVSELWAVSLATGAARRITEGDAVQPSWSPHNLRIAYWATVFSGPRAGQRDIWTIPAAGGAAVAVTSDAALDWNPVWSPDGRYLYFCSDRAGTMNLWRVRVDERSGRVLGAPEAMTSPSPFVRHLTVSADGRSIAYASLLRTGNIQRVAFDPRLAAVKGAPTTVLGGSRYLIAPAPSPDGEWLASYSQEDPFNIFVSRSDGSGLRQLTNDHFYNRNPTWSPDGREIAFFSNRSGAYQIWSIRPDGSGLRQLTDDAKGVSSYNVWSPDGKRMVFWEQGPEDSPVVIFEVGKPWNGQRLQTLPRRTATGVAVDISSWSPDGKRLAAFNGPNSGTFVYSFDTGAYTPLSEKGGFPIWMNDSRRLLFDDWKHLFVIDAGTRQMRQLMSVAPDSFERVALTRDNQMLYFSRVSEQGDLWLLTLR